MTLTKRDLVLRICEDTGLVQQHVLDIVQRTFDHIVKALAKGEKVGAMGITESEAGSDGPGASG